MKPHSLVLLRTHLLPQLLLHQALLLKQQLGALIQQVLMLLQRLLLLLLLLQLVLRLLLLLLLSLVACPLILHAETLGTAKPLALRQLLRFLLSFLLCLPPLLLGRALRQLLSQVLQPAFRIMRLARKGQCVLCQSKCHHRSDLRKK
jgi:hypothetical protein